VLVAVLLAVCSLLRVPRLFWLQLEWLMIVPRPPVVMVTLPVLLCEPLEALVLWKSCVLGYRCGAGRGTIEGEEVGGLDCIALHADIPPGTAGVRGARRWPHGQS